VRLIAREIGRSGSRKRYDFNKVGGVCIGIYWICVVRGSDYWSGRDQVACQSRLRFWTFL
jgi:hypothetical protein